MGGKVLQLESERLREEGRTFELYSLVQDGDISPERAAKRLRISVVELKDKMKFSGYQYPEAELREM